MATIYHERVGKGMQLLRDGLGPFVDAAVGTAVRDGKVRIEEVQRCAGDARQAHSPIGEWDVAALVKVMWDNWNEAFRSRRQASPERPPLGHAEQGLVSELRDWRNKWAHQQRFTRDDAYRALDSAERLLKAIAAPQAQEVANLKRGLLAPDPVPVLTEVVRRERPQPPMPSGSQADLIRQHALRRHVEPWRRSGAVRLSIRAGDVQRDMGLRNAAPNVCNVLKGRKFLELAGVKLVGHTEPCPSTTTVFEYERG